MDSPLVSVIMNCYNGEQYLRESIQSVINQTYTNWEIVFWDNCSTDKSAEIVNSYKDNRIRYFKNQFTEPLGLARNKALKEAKGNYITFLDVDDIWFPAKLDKQITLFNKTDDEVIVLYSDALLIYTNSPSKRKYSNTCLNNTMPEGYILKELLFCDFINWQTVMINKQLAEKALYFDNRFSFVEDYDILLRLALKGKFRSIKDPLVYYRIHNNSISSSKTGIQSEEMKALYMKMKELLSDEFHSHLRHLLVTSYYLKGRFNWIKHKFFIAIFLFLKVWIMSPIYFVKIFSNKFKMSLKLI